jgi:hypothetical protein
MRQSTQFLGRIGELRHKEAKMLHVNNVIQPCLLCGQPVTKRGSFFCSHCSIFQNKEQLEAALEIEETPTQHVIEPSLETTISDEYNTIVIDLNEEDDELVISYDIPE